MNRLLILSALVVIPGCTKQGDERPSISVVNNSHGSIICLAAEGEMANLVDIRDSLEVAKSLDRLLAVGESRKIEIRGYNLGKEIRIFIYRLATPDAVKAGYDTFIGVSNQRPHQLGHQIPVTD